MIKRLLAYMLGDFAEYDEHKRQQVAFLKERGYSRANTLNDIERGIIAEQNGFRYNAETNEPLDPQEIEFEEAKRNGDSTPL